MSHAVLTVEFVTEESNASREAAEIERSGGRLEGAMRPFDVPADLLDDYGDAQFEPFTILTASVAIGFLLKRVSDVWLDHARPGGQVVDTRGGKVVVRVAPHLQRGTLVLESNEGTRVFQRQDRDEALSILERVVLSRG